MKTIINRIIPCFLALLLLEGCTNDVFSLLGNKQQNPQMSIEAWTETALTKTLLSGEPDDSVRSICFLPLDSIAYSADLGEFEPFVNLGNDTLPYATFTGNLVEANMYFAVYPWKQAVNLKRYTVDTEFALCATIQGRGFCQWSLSHGVLELRYQFVFQESLRPAQAEPAGKCSGNISEPLCPGSGRPGRG